VRVEGTPASVHATTTNPRVPMNVDVGQTMVAS
jgi:hypothetical protein